MILTGCNRSDFSFESKTADVSFELGRDLIGGFAEETKADSAKMKAGEKENAES